MVKEIEFIDIGCGEAFDLAFDYLAVVEKIETWNVANSLNEIDRRETSSLVSNEELASFHLDVDPEQQVLRNEGEIPLGKNRKALVKSFRYEKPGLAYERFRTWHIQAKNREGKWYTSDVITMQSHMTENETSQYDVTIRSGSRDVGLQVAKNAFPPKYGKPVSYKCARSKEEKVVIDIISLNRHRWQLQDDLISYGATLNGSGKIEISIPKGEYDIEVIKTVGLLKNVYGFTTRVDETDSHYFIDSSEYLFKKLGLTKFLDGINKG